MTVIPNLKPQSIEDYTARLGNFFPPGRAFEARHRIGSILRDVNKGFAFAKKRIEDQIVLFLNEIYPNTTTLFIAEWEQALGIPDDCIPIAATDDERRSNIVLKLASLAIQTEEEYIQLAAQFGFTITITYEDSGFPFCVPKLIGTKTHLNNLVVMRGNYDTNPSQGDIFKCLAKKLIPAYATVVFESCTI